MAAGRAYPSTQGARRLSRLALSLGFTHAWDFTGGLTNPADAVTGRLNLLPAGAAGWTKIVNGKNGRGIQLDGNADHATVVAGNPFSTDANTFLWMDSGVAATGQAVMTTLYGGSSVTAESSGRQIRIVGSEIHVIKAQAVDQAFVSGRDNTGGLNVSAVSVSARAGARYAFAINGAIRGVTNGGSDFNTSFEYGTNALFAGADCPSSTVTYYCMFFAPKVISDEMLKVLTANPDLLWESPRPMAIRSTVAVVDSSLAGAASAQASATGALATTIKLSGAASSTASAAGTLSTFIRLAGAATAAATSAGALSTGIQLSGTASAAASASGNLSSGAAMLTGAAVANATAAGALTTAVRLAGSSVAQASAGGALATQIALAGSATAGASASGELSTGIVLSGAAVAVASASSSLAGGAAQLSGSAVASASASGALTTSVRMAGAATAQASASGSLGAAGAMLSGAAMATASASGALLTTIRMAGLAQASASASGALAGAASQLYGAAVANATAAGALVASIRLSGAAAARAAAVGELGGGSFIRPTIPTSRTVNFESSGSNRVNFDRGINRVNLDTGFNRVNFDSATNKVDF